MQMVLEREKKIYFASDVHLGAPSIKNHLEHEKYFVKWLDAIKDNTKELFLLGDIFDFWFEYKKVIPRGFTRFLGKICEFTDRGIPVHFFTGNHDLWVFDYLPKEIGVTIYREPITKVFNGKSFYLGHGDGLGAYDKKYNLLKKLFTNVFAQKGFAFLHPYLGMNLATNWSGSSRKKNSGKDHSKFLGEEKEWLMLYAKDILENDHYDYFIFGHRHVMNISPLQQNSTFIYLGDWVKHFSYGVWDGNTFELQEYKGESLII